MADVHSMITFNFHPTVYLQNVTSLQHSFQQRSEKMSSHWADDDLTCANEALSTREPTKDATLVISEERMPNPSIIAPRLAKLGHGRKLGWHTKTGEGHQSCRGTRCWKEIRCEIMRGRHSAPRRLLIWGLRNHPEELYLWSGDLWGLLQNHQSCGGCHKEATACELNK